MQTQEIARQNTAPAASNTIRLLLIVSELTAGVRQVTPGGIINTIGSRVRGFVT
jgi:hypothetical protein